MANTKGIDISFWQNDRSTPQYFQPRVATRQGVSFVGIKVSQATYADRDYIQNWAICREMLYRMPYHFLVWDVDPRRQAETFWGLLEKDCYAVLPLICDFEWWRTVPGNAMDILYNFLERMKQLTHLPIGIYTAKSFWVQHGTDAAYWQQYALWLCDIEGEVQVPKPWPRWDFWQYTFKLDGLAHGVESRDLDGDYYNGSLAEMRARYNLPALPGLAELPPDGAEPEPAQRVGTVLSPAGVRVRFGPSVGARMLGTLPRGYQVDVEEVRRQGTEEWIRIARGLWMCSRLGATQLVEVR